MRVKSNSCLYCNSFAAATLTSISFFCSSSVLLPLLIIPLPTLNHSHIHDIRNSSNWNNPKLILPMPQLPHPAQYRSQNLPNVHPLTCHQLRLNLYEYDTLRDVFIRSPVHKSQTIKIIKMNNESKS